MSSPALELHGISRRFGSVVALDNVSLSAARGSIHALLGENGAGKTTLMRIAFGMLQPDAGWIAVNGTKLDITSPASAIAAGIGMVHQQFSLVPAMTVAENVALGGRGRFRPEEIAQRIREVGERTGLTIDPWQKVQNLGSAERQKLEIVRTLAHDARILIMDEPTAVLTSRDVRELFTQLRSFADNGGSVVLITHKLHDAIAHADEVTVLRRGTVSLSAPMSGVDRAALTTAMLGAVPEDGVTQDRSPSRGAEVAKLENAAIDRRDPVSLTVFAGEILGVAALDGAASGILRALAGRLRVRDGSATIPDNVGFVPESRQDDAIIPEMSLTENLALGNAANHRGMMDWERYRSRTETVIRDFDVRASGVDADARELSGGNQQRFVLGRELEGNPPLLVLENPTQGLDVNAAATIHTRIREAASRGTAVVYYSSDIDELSAVSDRVLVVRRNGLSFTGPDRAAIGSLLLEDEVVRQSSG